MNSKIHCYIQSLNVSEYSPIEVIENVTKENGVFNFVELLDNEKIAQLKENSVDQLHLNLLKLFCYGTYRQYIDNRQMYPILGQEQLRKLKQLTIISLSMTNGVLHYSHIYEAIDERCQRTIEELILDLIYYNAIEGHFDQENECFQVESSCGRDFPIDQIGEMRAALCDWARKCDSVIDRLSLEFASANKTRSQRLLEHQSATANLEKAREEIAQAIRKEMSGQSCDNSKGGHRPELCSLGSVSASVGAAGAAAPAPEQGAKKKTLLRTVKKK